MVYWAYRSAGNGDPADRLDAEDETDARELAGEYGYILRTSWYADRLEWKRLDPSREERWFPTYRMARDGGSALSRIPGISRLRAPTAAIVGLGLLAIRLETELKAQGWHVALFASSAKVQPRGNYDAEFHLVAPPPRKNWDKAGIVVQCLAEEDERPRAHPPPDLTLILPALFGTEHFEDVDPRLLEIVEWAYPGQTRDVPVPKDGTFAVIDAEHAARTIFDELNSYAGPWGKEVVVRIPGIELARDQIAALIRDDQTPEQMGLCGHPFAHSAARLNSFGFYYVLRPQDAVVSGTVVQRMKLLRIRAALRFSDVAHMLGTTPATVSRWSYGQARPRPQNEKLLDELGHIVERLSDLNPDPKSVRAWLCSRHAYFDGSRPADLIQAGRVQEVEEAILALAHTSHA